MKLAVIKHFRSFNARRYGSPWVCIMDERGRHDFTKDVGIYTGNCNQGDEGDLIVFDPVENQVYGYGQKDHRKPEKSLKAYSKWNGEEFVPCDKLGTLKNNKE